MRHPDPDFDFYDTRMILQGASCIIAWRAASWHLDHQHILSRVLFCVAAAYMLAVV
jgi:hypothetical protein